MKHKDVANTRYRGNKNENHSEIPLHTHLKAIKYKIQGRMCSSWNVFISLGKVKMVEPLWSAMRK